MVNQIESLEKECRAYIVSNHLLPSKHPTLLAVSGGVDSVVLAHVFHKLGLPFAVAHANFGLRPEAAQEASFVSALAQHYGVDYYTTSLATNDYAAQHKMSIQMAARTLRYAWFHDLLAQHTLGAVATAHHVNDVMETLLRNLTKGTGIAGLRGILARQGKDGKVIRPLLFADKAQLIAYAQACGLTWQEDASNQETAYERNFIRHKIIPSLKTLNPSLEHTFHTTLGRLQQVDHLFRAEVQRLRKLAWRTALPYHYIKVEHLRKLPWGTIVLEAWLMPFGFHFKQLNPWLLKAPQAGKKLYTSSHGLLAGREAWIVGPKATIEGSKDSHESRAIPLSITSPLHSEVPWLQQRIYPTKGYLLPDNPYTAALDLGLLHSPLTIRPWQAGDTFYPLSRKQRYRKKVSDLLIDAKVPLHQKKDVSVLVSEGKIAWVIGYQIDDRFKVTAQTQQVWEATVLLPKEVRPCQLRIMHK